MKKIAVFFTFLCILSLPITFEVVRLHTRNFVTFLGPCSQVSRQLLSHSIRRKFHRIEIAFTRIWIDFLSCSHVPGYDSYPHKLYAHRPCVYTYPFLSYLDRLFTRVWARKIVHRIDLFSTFKGG